MTAPLWRKTYVELEAAGRKTFYCAIVREHHWEGQFIFQAQPNRGDWCIECTSPDKDDLIAKAESWLAGEMPDGFYSSSL